jgi:hypothetical protein
MPTSPVRARWKEYEAAYRFGDEMRSGTRYTGRGWVEVEGDLRNEWETRNAGSWEKFKATIRRG